LSDIERLKKALVLAHKDGNTQAALAIAKKIKQASSSGLGVEDDQAVFRLKDREKPEFDTILPSFVETPTKFLAQSALKGASKLARGVSSLPFELAGQEDIAKEVRQAIPEVKGGMAGTELGGTIAQYAFPAAAGYRAGRALLSSAKPAIRYVGGLLGAGVGDVAATIPEEASTLGTLLGKGPTKIEPEAGPLERRVKVGAETLALGPIVDVALSVPRGVKSILSKTGDDRLAREVQRQTLDVERATKNLEDYFTRQGIQPAEQVAKASPLARQLDRAKTELNPESKPLGYSPTVAEIADDIGLSALHNSVSRAPSMIARQQENLKFLAEDVKKFVDTTGDPFIAASQVSKIADDLTKTAKSSVEISEQSLASAQDDLFGEISAIAGASPRSVQESASERLSKAITDENIRLTEEVRRLYDNVDPSGSLKVDIRPLSKVADQIRKPVSELKQAEVSETVKYGKEIFDSIDASLDSQVKGNKVQSYKDLISFRSQINSKIGEAYNANATTAAKNLTKLRNVIDEYTDQLENFANKRVSQPGAKQGLANFGMYFDEIPTSAATAAKEANEFYKNVYVPRFKESVGADFVKKSKSGKLYPTKAAQMFLLGPTEGSRKLRQIISESPDRDFAEQAVKDFMVSQLSQVVLDKSGKVIPQTARQFSRKYAPILDEFPEIKKQIDEISKNFASKAARVGTLENQVKEANKALNLSEKEIKSVPFKFFLDDFYEAVEPDVAMSRVFTSERPDAVIKSMLNRFGDNPQFVESLKANVRDYLVSVSRNPALDGEISAKKVLGFLDQPKVVRSLETLYKPNELAKLNAVKSKLRDIAKVEATQALPKGALAKANVGERARIILASVYGIIRGRAIFTLTKMIKEQFSNLSPEQAAEEILVRALTDPELALILLKRDTEASSKQLRTYIANNIVGKEPAEE
jgi:hypothetical protein